MIILDDLLSDDYEYDSYIDEQFDILYDKLLQDISKNKRTSCNAIIKFTGLLGYRYTMYDIHKYFIEKSDNDPNINFKIDINSYHFDMDKVNEFYYNLYIKEDFHCKLCHTLCENTTHNECYILPINKKYYDIKFI